MKKNVVLCLLTVGVLALTACGGSSDSGKTDASSASSAAAADSGESYDVGEFTTVVPKGWMAVTQYDMMAEEDEEGNYPVDPTAIYVPKGAEEELDIYDHPSVMINVYKDTKAADQAENTLWFYDESKEIDVTVNGEKALAYEVVSEWSEEETYVYDLIYVQDGSDVLQFTVQIDLGENMKLNITDDDVVAILNGTSVN